MFRAFTPARRMNVGRVGVHPEVMAVGVSIEMEPQPVTTNLDGVKGEASHIQRPG